MGNNFSKRILPDEMAELAQEFRDSSIQGPLAKKALKNLKTFHSLGDLKMKNKVLKIERPCSGPGCSEYWSFLPRL